MLKERFHCKTNIQGITTTLVVVVMLLLFSTSCSGDNKEVVEVEFDPETTYTMRVTDVTSLISDSGITRYRMIAQEWIVFGKAEEPYWYFPEGVYLERFDSLFNAEATVKADTAYYFEKQSLWKLIDNVEIENQKGEFFETSLLFWDQKEEKVYSDKFIRIVQESEKVITGIGFESNQDMTQYVVFNSRGEFPVTDTAPRDTTRQDSISLSLNSLPPVVEALDTTGLDVVVPVDSLNTE